jgi:hypothetical protein
VLVKICRVSFRGADDIEHACEVEARSLYEAIGFALARFNRCLEIEAAIPAFTELKVVSREPGTEHLVKRSAFDNWLNGRGSSPADISARNRVREAMGITVDAKPNSLGTNARPTARI